MLSIEGKELPEGIKNQYWYWNKEHWDDNKNKSTNKANKSKKKKVYYKADGTIKDTKAWWRSLTATEQADWRYKKMCERGIYNQNSDTVHEDWMKEYDSVIKQNNYKH